MDAYMTRVAKAPLTNYVVVCVEGDRERMVRLLTWAREQREAGSHMGIFFSKGRLEVHTPREHFEKHWKDDR